MHQIDANNDGQIDFEEFIVMMQKITTKQITELDKTPKIPFTKPVLESSPGLSEEGKPSEVDAYS